MQVLLVFLSVTFVLSLGAKLPLGGTRNFDIQQRIQKGKDAHKGQFPYIVSLVIKRVDGNYGCGGSIIDHNWILTAAHCTHNAEWVQIFYGSTKNKQGEISHVIGSDNIIEHENYDMTTTHVNDIALIRTPRVEYSELVNKVSLADRDNDYEGAWGVASGWGKNENGRPQENLQFIDLQINSKRNCWNFVYEPSDTMICVGPFVGDGDSGGPLVTRDDPKLVGVASFLDPGRLGGFSRVSSYLDWIRNHTGLQ
ncbi:serine protease 1-like [Drosophila nasuta]|uniref:serine protease 1-like n=1 Tax=Drosophila nasuta TaxID=42062 RepID=UPI0014710F1E|nr:serine protease 1-like [Drosophila nasuta]